MRYLAVLLGLIIFANMEPGVYTGLCDGVPVTYTVEADGVLSADCQSIAVTLTSGGSVTCKERGR